MFNSQQGSAESGLAFLEWLRPTLSEASRIYDGLDRKVSNSGDSFRTALVR